MRVYSVGPRDDAQRLSLDVGLRVKMLRQLGSNLPWPGDWEQPKARRMEVPRKKTPGVLCDWTSVGAAEGLPAVSTNARAVVEPLLLNKVQWLPLDFSKCSYWLLNCLNVPDVLDLSAASVTRGPDGTVRSIEASAFRPSAVRDEYIFRVPGAPNSIFVTDGFRALADQRGLTGLFYQPVWDSEHAPFKPIPGRAEILTRPEIYGPVGFVPNVQELWPDEWKQRAREMKKRSGEAKVAR